jgi:hypothetical protein
MIISFRIDWTFGETVTMDVNCYESHRGPRREQLELVLTRREREKLLLEWGVPTHLIADGTRSALKVKNQRKQTVVNAGKVARLEEAIESASRRFKETFSLKSRSRQSGEQEEEEEEQEESGYGMYTKRSTTIKMKCHTPQAVNGARQDHNSITRVMSVESDIPSVTNVISDTPRGTITVSDQGFFDQHQVINDDDCNNDDGYTLGGTTLGNNSVSPSVLEMEKFYQELELEMFGEEASIPCMIGQTLEVSNCERDNNDIDDNIDDMTIASSALPCGRNPMVTAITASPHQDSRLDDSPMQGRLVTGNSRSQSSHYHVSEFPYLSPAPVMQYTTPESSTWTQHCLNRPQCPPRMVRPPPESRTHSYDPFSDYKVENCYGNSHFKRQQLYHFQISTSNPIMSWNEPAPSHHHLHNNTNNNNNNFLPPMVVYPDNRYDVEGCFDGPRICHTSLQHGHLSPHQWMEECDGPRSYANGSAVTIMEDDLA